MELKKIRMKTISAGPQGTYMPGQEIIVDEARAELLVSGGYAEYIDEQPKPSLVTLINEPEAATAEPPENAMMRPTKRRKAGK